MHSPGSEALRWEFVGMGLHVCKRCLEDDIYRWHECLWIFQNTDKMTPSLQNFGRRGIFQHDDDPKHTANITQEFLLNKHYDLAKYVT